MSHVPLTAARATLPALVDRVLHDGDRVVIERRGVPVAALVSIEDLARIPPRGAPTPVPYGCMRGTFRILKDDLSNPGVSEKERDELLAREWSHFTEDPLE